MSGYDFLATATGGVAFAGTPPERALAQVSSDLGAYYTLRYAAASNVTIRSKQGHRVRTALAAPPVEPDERMRLAVLSHLRAAPSSNDLGIALAADAARARGSDRVVPLKVMIPISNLLIEPDGSQVRGGFYVYIASGDGTVLKKRHAFHWPPGALAHGQGKNMIYTLDVTLPAGQTDISVGVRDMRSEKTGFERVAVGGK